VKIELVVVSGAEGRYMRQKQDDAIRSTLRWFAENRPQDAGLGALTAVPLRPLLTNDVLFRPSVLTHAAFGADLEVIREVSRNRVFTAERPILEKP
jgi:hypothetical protein